MVALQLNTLYNYFQQALLNNSSSSSSFATLILQAHKRVQDTLQSRKKLKSNQTQKLHILYPARSPLLETDHFFSAAEIVQQQTYESIKQQSHAGPITANYRAPREPIVLCHGLFGFDVRGPQTIPALQFHYWGGVEDALAKLGAKIIVTRVPQAGSIRERSQALHAMLKTILVGKKVNFVAHSMGGLDCRHLLASIPHRPYHVQSLTTICTPHRGSPVMDWFRDHMGLGQNVAPPSSLSGAAVDLTNQKTTVVTIDKQHDSTRRKSLDRIFLNWLDEPAYANLTTSFCNDHFNPNTPDDASVQYYSYGASASISAWSSLLGLPYQTVYEKEGENDGIVSVKSAKWGTYVKTIQADHWDLSGKSLIPYRLRHSESSNGKEFDRLEFYAELATHLYDQGH
ncbi:Alpha/Beta hydrolase protein [Choanephora cucurbitarum]|nr:Alpha/Beta hydrolase protein [Choanephora cucurbitarum]